MSVSIDKGGESDVRLRVMSLVVQLRVVYPGTDETLHLVVWLNAVDARNGSMKISLRMLLCTDSLCGAAEIVLCLLIELLLFYIQ